MIGGSFGLSLKKRSDDYHIIGWDAHAGNLARAFELGLVDEAATGLEAAVQSADWIVLAVPVDAIEHLLPHIMRNLRQDQYVVDFGSTKEQICRVADTLPNRRQFLAAHPIAGTEYSGPEAAFSSLYEDKMMIVCDQEKTAPEALEVFRKLCKLTGMTTTYLSAASHDVHLAYVSHLSHVIAFSLSQTVLKKEEDDNRILDLAGSGFASTVRLAKSSPEMWTPIFLKNKKAILESIDQYMEKMGRFRDFLENEETTSIHEFLTKGREIRKILK